MTTPSCDACGHKTLKEGTTIRKEMVSRVHRTGENKIKMETRVGVLWCCCMG